MNGYFARIEIEEKEIKEVMERLTNAQKEIYECYDKLQNMGAVVIKKRGTATEDSTSSD